MEGSEQPAASGAEQLAHARPAVERWLAWSGLVPLPAFLMLHLTRELSLAFATDVTEVLRPTPSLFVIFTSVLLVWLPLGVHVTLGSVRLLSRAVPLLPGDVPAMARWVSRASAAVALAFLILHARSFSLAVWLGEAAPEDSGFRLVAELSSSHWGLPLLGAAYLLGLLATVAHASLGVHRGLLRVGLLSNASKRRASARWCAAFGSLAFCLGAAAVIRVASGVLLR